MNDCSKRALVRGKCAICVKNSRDKGLFYAKNGSFTWFSEE